MCRHSPAYSCGLSSTYWPRWPLALEGKGMMAVCPRSGSACRGGLRSGAVPWEVLGQGLSHGGVLGQGLFRGRS